MADTPSNRTWRVRCDTAHPPDTEPRSPEHGSGLVHQSAARHDLRCAWPACGSTVARA